MSDYGRGAWDAPKAAMFLGYSAEIIIFCAFPRGSIKKCGQKNTVLDAIPYNLIGNTVKDSQKKGRCKKPSGFPHLQIRPKIFFAFSHPPWREMNLCCSNCLTCFVHPLQLMSLVTRSEDAGSYYILQRQQ